MIAINPLNPQQILDYFEATYEVYLRAEQASRQVYERWFQIGGYRIVVRGPNATLLQRMTIALAHLEAQTPQPASLTIHLWDSDTPAHALPLSPLAWYRQHQTDGQLAAIDTARLDARGEVAAFNSDRIRTSFHIWPNMLYLHDVFQNRALFWIDNAHSLPYYVTGAPFSKILAWWFNERQRQFIHAGAVGSPAGGVLLVGPGGAGKSTSALACLGSELSYAGDDYCLVGADPTPHVYSLYNTAKLKNRDDLTRFPHLLSQVQNIERLGDEKALMFLYPDYRPRLIAEFPLRAILIPRVIETARASLTPVSAPEGLRSLAPSTIHQTPSAGQTAMQLMGRLVRAVPCYRFNVGSDLTSIPLVIQDLLARG